MIERIAFALFCLVTTMARAEAIECATKPSAGTYSQYRVIDGRRCWYPGKHTREKSELSWSAPAVAPVLAASVSIPVPAPPAPAQVSAQNFTTRWVDLPAARALPQQVYDRLDADVFAGRSFAPVRAGLFDAAMLYTEPPRSPTAVVASSMSSVGSSLMSIGWMLLVSSVLAVGASLRGL